MDLRVVPHVCIETGPTVTWKLVRVLPTVELVRRDCPQRVGSVLPSDSCLGSACTNGGLPEPLSHIADRFWYLTAQFRSLV